MDAMCSTAAALAKWNDENVYRQPASHAGIAFGVGQASLQTQ
jgi:hypothetical protein